MADDRVPETRRVLEDAAPPLIHGDQLLGGVEFGEVSLSSRLNNGVPPDVERIDPLHHLFRADRWSDGSVRLTLIRDEKIDRPPLEQHIREEGVAPLHRLPSWFDRSMTSLQSSPWATS